MADALPSSSDVVRLNVGGTLYSTTRATLMSVPETMLATLMETDIPVSTDDEGRIFIDRDGKHFGTILNYLRDGDFAVPSTATERKELKTEAAYYLLDDIVAAIDGNGVGSGLDIDVLLFHRNNHNSKVHVTGTDDRDVRSFYSGIDTKEAVPIAYRLGYRFVSDVGNFSLLERVNQ